MAHEAVEAGDAEDSGRPLATVGGAPLTVGVGGTAEDDSGRAAEGAEFDDGVAVGGKRGRVAASSEAILGLKKVKARDATLQTVCAVCLEEFGAGETLRAMPCAHAFHQDCIFEWLRRNGVCPLCRHQLPAQEGIDQQPSVLVPVPVPEE